jgi:hypothetical protein
MSYKEFVHVNSFLTESPYALVERFAGGIRPEILRHRVPALSTESLEIMFSTYGVAGATGWVHEGKYAEDAPSPMLFNWKTLLGLTAHDRLFLCELIERRQLHLAMLVWFVAEPALRRYDVCVHEMFTRELQASFADYLDPGKLRTDLVSHPLLKEERPVFHHYYNEQLNSPEFMAAVRETFELTFAPLSDSQDVLCSYICPRVANPDDMSMLYMNLIRGPHKKLPTEVIVPRFPSPPFGPAFPGKYLYEIFYANTFRYRPAGVSTLAGVRYNGEELPKALVINFDKFIPYRQSNMLFYNKISGKKPMSMYDIAVTAVEVLRRHFYGVLHSYHLGAYYDHLRNQESPVPEDELATTLVLPLPALNLLREASAKYGINYLVETSTLPRRARRTGVQKIRRKVSAKSVLSVMSPDTPYLEPAEFRFVHRYGTLLVSPPWPLTMAHVLDYYKEERVVRVTEHQDRVFVPVDLVSRLSCAQDYMTPELSEWLRYYSKMTRFVFMEELRMHHKQMPVNRIVRTERGADRMRFTVEEDEAIIRLYRPRMSAESKSELKAICFGRRGRSIAMRAGILRKELMAKGVYDLTQLPHGARTESILKEIRDAKKANMPPRGSQVQDCWCAPKTRGT